MPNSSQNEDAAQAVQKLKKKVREYLGENLHDNEKILVVIRGAHGQAIVGTESRLFILKPGMMAGASFGIEATSWMYGQVAGIQMHKGIMSGSVIVQGPGQSGQATSFWRGGQDDPSRAPNAIPVMGDWGQVKKGVTAIQHLIHDAHQEVPAKNNQANKNQPSSALATELEKITDLYKEGLLTADEFAQAKKNLLD